MTKIAYLGLGIMGSGMAANLLQAGHEVTVWNRSADRCAPLVEKGAKQAHTPAEAVADAEVIMYCMGDDKAVEAVVWGADGILAGVKAGQIAVDMTTEHPDTARRQYAAYAEKGVEFIDAPVFGSRNEAAEGRLCIVAGGKADIYAQVKPLFDVVAQDAFLMGENGMGASMKLTGNMVVSILFQATGEALMMAMKSGLNPRQVLEVLDVVDFSSPFFKGVGSGVLDRNFDEVFFALKWLLKDANLVASFAQGLNAPIPAASATRELIKAGVNSGWGEQNCSAYLKVLERLGGVEFKG
jgi:glyoxylate/succinic semialdehyde reductase